jgi:hypothetical protein
VDRAISLYAPTYFGKQPVPYFAASEAATLSIQPPVFSPIAIDPRTYRDSPSSVGDYLAFLARIGTPMLLHDDVLATVTCVKQAVGIVASPASNRQLVVEKVYAELDQLCQDVGATLVIVVLDEQVPSGTRESFEGVPNALVVDAHQALVSRLPVPQRVVFQRHYLHWRGDPPELVDHHPNPYAHQIIAAEILAALRQHRAGTSLE